MGKSGKECKVNDRARLSPQFYIVIIPIINGFFFSVEPISVCGKSGTIPYTFPDHFCTKGVCHVIIPHGYICCPCTLDMGSNESLVLVCVFLKENRIYYRKALSTAQTYYFPSKIVRIPIL